MQMILRPIGTVISKSDKIAEIEVYPSFSAGLKGVEQGSNILIIFWMHKLSEAQRDILETYPMGDRSRGKRGVFALRSPMRPNPMGLTKVEVIERKENVLIVSGLDAFEDSPIIDIKPA